MRERERRQSDPGEEKFWKRDEKDKQGEEMRERDAKGRGRLKREGDMTKREERRGDERDGK